MMSGLRFFALTTILALAAGVSVYGQGRGRIPQAPPQSQDPGRFPGFPPNAGAGQPETPGQPPIGIPQPDENADPRAFDGAANAGLEPDLQASASAVDQLSRVPRLAERLEGMVTLGEGQTLADLAGGFPNLGLFVAAVHVSNNVEGTTFDGLKTHMLDGDGMSLGEAIQTETDLDAGQANEAAGQAENQAEELIDETS